MYSDLESTTHQNFNPIEAQQILYRKIHLEIERIKIVEIERLRSLNQSIWTLPVRICGRFQDSMRTGRDNNQDRQ